MIHPPRKIPVALLEPAKIREIEEDGIIVKEEGHTPWVSSMLIIDKRKDKEKDRNTPPSKGEVRIYIDPRDLNNALKRPHYPMVTVEEVANRMTNAKMFTSLDACSGYWQLDRIVVPRPLRAEVLDDIQRGAYGRKQESIFCQRLCILAANDLPNQR